MILSPDDEVGCGGVSGRRCVGELKTKKRPGGEKRSKVDVVDATPSNPLHLSLTSASDHASSVL